MPSIIEGWYLSSSTDGVLALGGQCTIDPSPSPPSMLEDIFKYGGLRNSCSIFVLVLISRAFVLGSSKFLCLSPMIRGVLCGVDTKILKTQAPGLKI